MAHVLKWHIICNSEYSVNNAIVKPVSLNAF